MTISKLILAVSWLLFPLQALSDIVSETPVGVQCEYELSTTQIRRGESMTFSGVLINAVHDGNTVWLQDPITAFGFGTWICGEIRGDEFIVRSGQQIHHQDRQDNYPEMDIYVRGAVYRNDYVYVSDDDEIVFGIDEEGRISIPYGQCLVAVDGYGAVQATDCGYSLMPFDGDAAAVEPPGDVPSELYCLHYREYMFDNDIYRLVNVKHDARDGYFYIQGLSGTYAPQGWVRGRLDGDYVRFPTGQYQGIAEERFVDYFVAGYADASADDGFGRSSALTFAYSSGDGSMTSSGTALEMIGDRIFVSSCDRPSLRKHVPHGGAPAKPGWRYITRYPEFTVISFKIDPVDENGVYIDAENISWRLHLDGRPYVFTAEKYAGIQCDKEFFRWGETDEKSMDVVFESCGLYTIWLYDDFTAAAVEVFNDFDGTRYRTMGDTNDLSSVGAEAEVGGVTPLGEYSIDGIMGYGRVPGGVVIRTGRMPDGSIRVEKVRK